MNRFVAVLGLTFVCAAWPAGILAGDAPESRPACEPAGDIDVSAAIVAREDRGSSERVQIDVKVHSRRLPGEALRITGSAPASEIPARVFSVAAKEPRKIRYTLDLVKGMDHHLVFDVRSLADPSRGTVTSLRLNLDPNTMAEELDGVVQYRARMQGR